MNYSPELKESLLRRMLPPNNESISKIAREEGISEQTLRNWRDKARANGIAAPGIEATPDDWSSQDKFLIVVGKRKINQRIEKILQFLYTVIRTANILIYIVPEQSAMTFLFQGANSARAVSVILVLGRRSSR